MPGSGFQSGDPISRTILLVAIEGFVVLAIKIVDLLIGSVVLIIRMIILTCEGGLSREIPIPRSK